MSRENENVLGAVGAKMRRLREQRNMSLRALAQSVDVTPSLISQIETGKINPSVASLYAIANALDVPMDAFFAPESTDDGSGGDDMGERRTTPVEARASREAAMNEADEALAGGQVVPRKSPRVIRARERNKIKIDGFGGELTWERLTAGVDPVADFLEVCYEPGASSAQNLIMHQGREYGLVLEGELTIDLAFEKFVLQPGDSISFDSSIPHRLSNQGDVPVRAVWFVVNLGALMGVRGK
ncbi:MAG: helix-turn-helix domain-containing protein [Thermoleophilia bacterium]